MTHGVFPDDEPLGREMAPPGREMLSPHEKAVLDEASRVLRDRSRFYALRGQVMLAIELSHLAGKLDLYLAGASVGGEGA